MSLSQNLWLDNNDLAQKCLNNQFVQGILLGDLNQEKFAYYVSQDAFFLRAFARAYVIAGAKAQEWEDFIKLHGLAEGVLEEMKLHRKYSQSLGIDIDNVEPAVATSRYVDFVMATAWGHNTGMVIVALAPCMRLYAWLGKTLANQQKEKNTYSDWIETYSADDIEELATELESLVDKYADPNDPQIKATYRYAMVCELDFFKAAFDFAT